MILYASRTGTLRNLAAMDAAGIRLLLTPLGDTSATGGRRYALDNGAWSAFCTGTPWDEDRFERALARRGGGADWVVLPDIVAGGLRSLELSTRYMNRVLGEAPLALIAVQDGMEHADLAPLVGPSVGVFMGGSTEWKLARMADWGAFCAERGVHYHVARVNTVRRIRMAAAAGATSIDGSSATRFAATVPLLAGAIAQPDLLSPRLLNAKGPAGGETADGPR